VQLSPHERELFNRAAGESPGALTEDLVNDIAACALGARSTRSRFQSFLKLAIAAVGCVGAILTWTDTAAAQQLPSINVQQTCQIASAVMVSLVGGSTSESDVKICLETENKAREQIIKDWSTYQPSDREGCIDPAIYLPSYVEWLTCFEMNKVVRESRASHRAAAPNAMGGGVVTLPRVPWSGRF
jgi:hypothetical protein